MSLEKVSSWKYIYKVYVKLYEAYSYLSMYKCCNINCSYDKYEQMQSTKNSWSERLENYCGLHAQTAFRVD